MKGLSEKLQGRSIDVAHAYTKIYQWLRLHSRKLDVALIRFMKLFIRMQLHWLTVLKLKSLVLELQANQLHRSNTPAVNASQYY